MSKDKPVKCPLCMLTTQCTCKKSDLQNRIWELEDYLEQWIKVVENQLNSKQSTDKVMKDAIMYPSKNSKLTRVPGSIG